MDENLPCWKKQGKGKQLRPSLQTLPVRVESQGDGHFFTGPSRHYSLFLIPRTGYTNLWKPYAREGKTKSVLLPWFPRKEFRPHYSHQQIQRSLSPSLQCPGLSSVWAYWTAPPSNASPSGDKTGTSSIRLTHRNQIRSRKLTAHSVRLEAIFGVILLMPQNKNLQRAHGLQPFHPSLDQHTPYPGASIPAPRQEEPECVIMPGSSLPLKLAQPTSLPEWSANRKTWGSAVGPSRSYSVNLASLLWPKASQWICRMGSISAEVVSARWKSARFILKEASWLQ